MIKHRDYYTTEEEVTELAPVSILSRRSLAEIAEDEGGDIKKAATGDPKKIPRRTGVKRRKKGAKGQGLAQQPRELDKLYSKLEQVRRGACPRSLRQRRGQATLPDLFFFLSYFLF